VSLSHAQCGSVSKGARLFFAPLLRQSARQRVVIAVRGPRCSNEMAMHPRRGPELLYAVSRYLLILTSALSALFGASACRRHNRMSRHEPQDDCELKTRLRTRLVK
jgi:hypothetical protein